MITFYTTHCPKCKVLEMKLKAKKVQYQECDDTNLMMEKGIKQAPTLNIDGAILGFSEAVKYVNNL